MHIFDDYYLEDLGPYFKSTNKEFYEYCNSFGLEIDLSKKDQKKIYTHFFIKKLCERIQYYSFKIIFYVDDFSLCQLHRQIIKKIKRIFGFKIWIGYIPCREFATKLSSKHRDVEVYDKFQLFLNEENKPKSFRHIKKYLEKEGMTNLSDSYFRDITNKMIILI